jgi:hypothetical protein
MQIRNGKKRKKKKKKRGARAKEQLCLKGSPSQVV